MLPPKEFQLDPATAPNRHSLNKVPAITLFFWVIKVLCTTVGETAADFLNTALNLGATGKALLVAALLAVVLAIQFRAPRYVPAIYWLAVVLLSVLGTMITDNLVNDLGVPLELTAGLFGVALAATFAGWYASERILSIHTIVTSRREVFYWLAILFTFALGTAAGDLVAESLNLGYLVSVLLFGAAIALVAGAHRFLGLNAILAFWLAYILTRPLGASLGDLLAQPRDSGGLELGTVVTSALFLVAILATVSYLTVTKRDTGTASTVA